MKGLVRNFEDFAGLDYRATDLTRSREYAKDLQNYQYGEGSSLVGRFGAEVQASSLGILKIHRYTYFDPDTGETKEELIGIGPLAWRLKTGTITVTRDSSGGISTSSIDIDMNTGSGRVTVSEDGSPITFLGGETFGSLGYGAYNYFADSTNPGTECATIWDLYAAIDALSGWTCTAPDESAKINVFTNLPLIGVESGHTLAEGDLIAFKDLGSTYGWFFRKIRATTTTTLTLKVGSNVRGTVGQVIGPGAAAVAGITKDSIAVTPGGASVDIEFDYWEPIPWMKEALDGSSDRDDPPYLPFGLLYRAYLDEENYDHPVAYNAEQNAYICTRRVDKPAEQNYSINRWEGYPHKYDGHSLYRAGVPPMKTYISAGTNGAGVLTGTYKYSCRWVQIDSKGVRREGNPNSIYADYQVDVTCSSNAAQLTIPALPYSIPNEQILTVNGTQGPVTQVTVDSTKDTKEGDLLVYLNRVTGDLTSRHLVGITSSQLTATSILVGTTSNVNDNDQIYINPLLGFNVGGAQVSGSQSGVKTITVDSDHDFVKGDTVLLYDGNQAKFTTRLLTSVTLTSITFTDGPAVDVADNEFLSKNLFVEVYRTEADGSIYYYNDMVIPPPYAFNFTFDDNKADADLGEAIIEPPIGLEHDLPPKARIGAVHQGTVVLSGIPDEPNAIYPATASSAEYFPATKSIDIPFAQTGPISAIASDSDDRLAVFKDNSYYDVQGDLLGSVVAVPVTEGDYGVASQSSIAKINGTIIGLGKLGFVLIRNGQIVKDASYGINPAFLNNTDLLFSRAVGVNDYTTRQYICAIPKKSTFDSEGGDATTMMFAFNYEEESWFNLSYGEVQAPLGGFAVYGDKLYGCSIIHSAPDTGISSGSYQRGILWKRTDAQTDTAHMLIDIFEGSEYKFTPQPWTLGQPSLEKEIHGLKVWSLPTLYDDLVTGFTLTTKFYANFLTASIYETGQSLVFTSADVEDDIRVPTDRVRGLQVELKCLADSNGERPRISGVELMYGRTYKVEDFLP